ncbi:ISP domain-containing protein [Lophiostoma macrostomum CBS 122681]|uniref:ISP domain-containing protein n=1 Tax=Lophiostoma macrostomum CBS 122681 TaxID=1314788 RepID=A0A6A6TQV9_9PLEO|nr:ISP domain-containing protein [Lophiostoma macrostomum CBS 122681]
MSITDNSMPRVTKEPDLLDGWWTSEYNFSLEQRAILGKTWICIAHCSRFTKPGDYISMDLAGFPIIVILGKDRIARTFHNVCRHRAYTVTKKPAGSSLVLGCRYHGWSYDTRGTLVKAPHFDNIPGFDKSENGLFKVRTCMDRGGFIYVNLDSGNRNIPDCDGTIPFALDHGLSATSRWLTSWEVKGAFNWKTIGASDRTGIGTTNYSTGYPVLESIKSIFRRSGVDTSRVVNFYISSLTSIFVFPASKVWAMATAFPMSAGECRLRCDIFTITQEKVLNEGDEKVLRAFFDAFVHDLEQQYTEIKLEVSLGSHMSSVHQAMKDHLKLERQLGRRILPGRKDEERSEGFCRAERVCRELDEIEKMKPASGHSTARADSMQGDVDW